MKRGIKKVIFILNPNPISLTVLPHLSEADYLVFIAVPSVYPMDEELVKLSMVNQLQRLGLAQHFVDEIDQILSVVHR